MNKNKPSQILGIPNSQLISVGNNSYLNIRPNGEGISYYYKTNTVSTLAKETYISYSTKNGTMTVIDSVKLPHGRAIFNSYVNAFVNFLKF